MSLAIAPESLPLIEDSAGVIRVGGTRVTLETVVEAFNEGATAEEIAAQYPALHLGDIYATITYSRVPSSRMNERAQSASS
ncbi:MAG: DUF433 domain-containing protein [Acidobacteriia bacterium]|nr:DUF433 domain-containing protein [Terriglobia bacterium]